MSIIKKSTDTYRSIIHKLVESASNSDVALVTYNDNFTIKDMYTWLEYCCYVEGFYNFVNRVTNEYDSFKHVAIHSFNCPEWFFSCYGAIAARRHVSGIYNSNIGEQCIHVLRTGECGILVLESEELFEASYASSEHVDFLVENKVKILFINQPSNKEVSDRIKEHIDRLKSENLVFHWKEEVTQFVDANSPKYFKKDVANKDKFDFKDSIDSIELDDCAILIFTSGTTSAPKAVELSHRNIMTAIDGVLKVLDLHIGRECVLSYLPLSHIAGQCLDLHAHIYHCGEVHFARSDALKGSLKDSMIVVKPTVFLGVPRVWEKFREAMLKIAAQTYSGRTGFIKKGISSLMKGSCYYYNTSQGMFAGAMYLPYLLSSQVINQIKEKLGLSRCRYFVTGAAPISKECLEYFMSLNMGIFEMYGMSETSAVIACSDPMSSLKGSVGKPIEGLKIRIAPGTDEIQCQGENIFKKYYNYDGDTSDLFTEDGYFRTGDCGRIDKEGNLYITGRIKELIITEGGENIPPVLIEDKIKELGGFNNTVVLIGDKRKFLSLLVFKNEEGKTPSEDEINDAIVKYNNKHAASRAQRVQKFTVIDEIPSEANNLLTSTMKLKRKIVTNTYAEQIDKMYNEK